MRIYFLRLWVTSFGPRPLLATVLLRISTSAPELSFSVSALLVRLFAFVLLRFSGTEHEQSVSASAPLLFRFSASVCQTTFSVLLANSRKLVPRSTLSSRAPRKGEASKSIKNVSTACFNDSKTRTKEGMKGRKTENSNKRGKEGKNRTT